MEELNLNQLEVGEWYELKGSADWLKWFSKHKGIHDGNCEISSEFIQQSSGLNFKKHAYTWGTDYTFRKATKEQLKSFLPKDHPDYPIENSDYKWLLILQENIDCTNYEKGDIAEIDRLNGNSFRMKRFGYDIMLSGLAVGKIKPFLTKEEAEKYWDSINVKSIETPKTKQLSDLKKGDWVKHISPSNTYFILNHLYKLDRDWDNQEALILNAQNRGDGYSPNNANNFTVPTQQEIETLEKSLIKDEPKEFILPEKWCIKQNASQIVCDWFGEFNSTRAAKTSGNFTYLVYDRVSDYTDYASNPNCPEITLEQFEKYVLKSKVTVEDKPKEDMKTIPKYWYIENKYQEVIDYLADTYTEECIKNWTNYNFIGFTDASSHKGCLGFTIEKSSSASKATKLTIEQFREYFLSKPKEVLQDDYSWWYELEAGDVIESLIDLTCARKKGDIFTILDVRPEGVSYRKNYRSCKKEEWKLISKAKDKVKEPSIHRIETTITTSPNWYEKSINDEPIAQFCPQPEETEIVPISKYFKIRN